MSVWKTPHYRDAAAQWGLRYIGPAYRGNLFFRSLLDFEIEDPGEFALPEGIVPGNFRSQCTDKPLLVNRIDANANPAHNVAIGILASELPAATIGIQAVYQVAAHILSRVEDTQVQEEGKENVKFFEKAVQYGFAASNHSEKDAACRKDALKEAAEGHWEKANIWIQDLVRLRGYCRSASQRAESFRRGARREAYPEVPKSKTGLLAPFKCYSFPGAILLVKRLGFGAYFLTSQDLERVDRVVRGLSIGDVYSKLYFALPPKARRTFTLAKDKYVQLITKVMCGVKKNRVNEVCRAFDVAYCLYIADGPAGDDRRAYKEQQKKFADEKLEEILSYSEVKACVAGLPIKEAMEILLLYKALPQPDFDYFGAANRQETMYKENKAKADEDGAAMGPLFDEIMEYHKLLMIRAFFSRHQVCPGVVKDDVARKPWHGRYPHLDPNILAPEDSNDIDFNGDFIWKERGTDNLDLVKDKAILPKNVDLVTCQLDVGKMPVPHKNYLMDVITRQVPIDARLLLGKLARGEIELDVRGDDKAEAKKKWQRMFFELASEARMILSIYEDSITDYAVKVPGFFQGKSIADKTATMNNITRPIPAALPFRALQFCSDVMKFSPYLPERVHKALDAQWAEAFGLDELNHMHKIFTEGKVHYIKGCVHHSFDKVGVDFEGFAGKKLTMYHCAVMATAVKRLRQRNLIVGPGRFAALIDDGLLRVDLHAKNYDVVKPMVVDEIADVYAKAALRISWDKTYTSEYFATFLHEVRYAGRSLTAGMRAVLKMTSRADEPIDSLAADLSVAASTGFGAIAAGAPQVATYVIYLMFCVNAMRRWGKGTKVFKAKHAFRMWLPMQYGGLGLESITTMSGSLKGPTVPECLGHLELIGYRFPEVQASVNAVLTAKMFSPSKIAKVQNPGNMMVFGARLRNDRLLKLIELNIVKRIRSPVLSSLLGMVSDGDVTFVELALDAGSFIPQPLRDIMMDGEKFMVINKLAKKFLTARSALCIVPRRAFLRVAMKNRSEAAAVLRNIQ